MENINIVCYKISEHLTQFDKRDCPIIFYQVRTVKSNLCCVSRYLA